MNYLRRELSKEMFLFAADRLIKNISFRYTDTVCVRLDNTRFYWNDY
jgi:hypothetical protein